MSCNAPIVRPMKRSVQLSMGFIYGIGGKGTSKDVMRTNERNRKKIWRLTSRFSEPHVLVTSLHTANAHRSSTQETTMLPIIEGRRTGYW